MTESAWWSRDLLLDNLKKCFVASELHHLCFVLEVDYESIPGEGKADKALGLVEFMERNNRLQDLENAVRHERPFLDDQYSDKRTRELGDALINTTDPYVRRTFAEYRQQIEAYLKEFNSLHEQLEEWKQVHSKLQEIQQEFAPCHSYKYALSKLKSSDPSVQSDKERLLYEIEIEWRPCRRRLRELKILAENIHFIGEPYKEETASGPDWFLQPRRSTTKVDEALRESDILALVDCLSEFDTVIGDSLFRADKFLLGVANRINRLPRPS